MPSLTTWIVNSAGVNYRVRTCSARTALLRVQENTAQPAALVGIKTRQPRAAVINLDKPKSVLRDSRFTRRKDALLPEVVRLAGLNYTIAAIARSVHVPRETVRDWLIQSRQK